ncbi:MAG TPA: DUF2520 domain-containing protein, partial [Solirubrobacterales bacterium]|nr:DUF2520 domain-containing protein [Solirubrobacterales bacterium]
MRELERDTSPAVAPDAAREPIVVIGRGRVGGALSKSAAGAGLAVTQIGREADPDALAGARVALICVPDTEIEAAALAIAGRAPSLAFAGHTSGACSLEPLAPLAESGAEPFSLHPLQTVPDPGSSLAGAPAAISGASPAALALARDLAEAVGMRP